LLGQSWVRHEMSDGRIVKNLIRRTSMSERFVKTDVEDEKSGSIICEILISLVFCSSYSAE
jgi:hypothetical protein